MAKTRSSPPSAHETVVILHSLALTVEQLCAHSPDAPSIEDLRPSFCVSCGNPARDSHGVLQLVGHGTYSRQVRGLFEVGWIVIFVRRFLCLGCGRTISRLPDWLHPWRWYAAAAIIEALVRDCILLESSRSIGVRFGRPVDESSWRSLRRWRVQLLISLTLWGWLGPRLGIRKPTGGKKEVSSNLHRLLAEANRHVRSCADFLKEVPAAVHATLFDLVHNRKTAGNIRQFPPGPPPLSVPASAHDALPTEKASGTDPP